MNNKKIKKAGRKWAIISTAFGIVSALIIWFYEYNYSSLQIFKQFYFYVGVFNAFIIAFYLGGLVVTNSIKKGDNLIQIWILLGFVTSCLSVVLPFILISDSITIFIVNIAFGMWCIAIFGFIPILFFGYIFGSLLKKEIDKIILNKPFNTRS